MLHLSEVLKDVKTSFNSLLSLISPDILDIDLMLELRRKGGGVNPFSVQYSFGLKVHGIDGLVYRYIQTSSSTELHPSPRH